MLELPYPPEEYRRLVGPVDVRFFDNPSGAPLFPNLPLDQYASVLDFGCGCGRLARQFLQQQPRPGRYLGFDRHAGMIDWCRSQLAPAATTFYFRHHNAWHPHLNPDGVADPLPFPAADASATTWFLFDKAGLLMTHIVPPAVRGYQWTIHLQRHAADRIELVGRLLAGLIAVRIGPLRR
jgi:SAM-dependent methyltransferase